MSKKITVYSLMLSKSLRKTFLQTTLLRHLAYLRELLANHQLIEIRETDQGIETTFQLSIFNPGVTSLQDVKLELSKQYRHDVLDDMPELLIPDLAAGQELIAEWIVSIQPIMLHLSNEPLFFHGIGKDEVGNNLNICMISYP